MPINNSQERNQNQGGQPPVDLDQLKNYPFFDAPEDGSFESLPNTDFVKQLFNKIQERFPEKAIVVEDLGSAGWKIIVDNMPVHIGIKPLNTAIGAQTLDLRPTIKKSEYNQYPWFKEILNSMASEVVFIN